MASTASSSASLPTHLFKYDVFLSFSGEDTRHSFISHLHAALCRKSIKTFIDDELRRGEEISQGLLYAIEESMFAVVIFSKGYAFSKWCLNELAKIVECIDTREQVVIPIFYHVDPSDVRKQTGTFAQAFVEHEANFNSNMEKLQTWRTALTKAANLSGWATQDCRSESAIVDGIVHRIWKDLQKMRPSPLTGLVGIGPRIEQLRTFLCRRSSNNVFILGLWGMGGIGKTTIAKALYGQIKCRFERYCFLENVREVSEKRGLETLGGNLLSKVLEERSIRISVAGIQEFFYILRDLKVLLVLDDVDDTKQIEYLAGDRSWFGPGSRIIITSRDRQVFKNVADDISEVKALLYPDAIQLFSLHAFKHNAPTDDVRDLSTLAVGYAKGVPLALKVLGSSLYGKSKREWESALKKLKNAPKKEIQDLLRVRYAGLDKEQKQIFLWLTCLLNQWKKDRVIELLNSCDFSTEIGLSILFDKSLITISDNDQIEMHDLLREIGREFVHEESEDPGERSWLWNQENIYQVFRKNSGTKKLKGIQLKTDQMKEVQLHPDTFERMSNLIFLQIKGWNSKYKVHLPKGISAFPDELRYLHWEEYTLESLPANFNPENLIELQLPNSNIVELFHEEPQDLGKLRLIDLSFSPQLCKIPNLSRTPNVKELCAAGCPKLRSPDDFSDLKSLIRLDLSGSMLETFPKVPQSIVWLDLSVTAIKEVPSEMVKCLKNLVELNMGYCSQLKSLPGNIDLKSLKRLCFSGCSSLNKFSEISKNLEELHLDETAITKVPSSIVCLSRLCRLSMRGCTELRILPRTIWKLQSLELLRLNGCSNITEFPQTTEEQQEENFSLGRREYLYLGRLYSSLTELHLRRNSFKAIPSSIKQLSELKILDISECKSLQSLPDLPPNLQQIIASGCTSLETVGLTHLSFESNHFFNFASCLKLDRKGSVDAVHALMRNPHLSNFKNQNGCKAPYKEPPSVSTIHPGSRIPDWFEYQSVGNSISFQLPPNWLNDGFLGFALGLVYRPLGTARLQKIGFEYELRIGNTFIYRSKLLFFGTGFNGWRTETEHIVLGLDCGLRSKIRRNAHKFTQSNHDVVSIKFRDFLGLKQMCAVNPLYAQKDGYNTLQLPPPVRPAEAAHENKRCRDVNELGRNGWSEVDEEPGPKKLKQSEGVQHQH